MKIHIKGGRLIDPKNGIDAARDLYIAAGKIVAVGAPPDGLPSLREVIDRNELRAKKNLGQNFLLDLNLTRRIA